MDMGTLGGGFTRLAPFRKGFFYQKGAKCKALGTKPIVMFVYKCISAIYVRTICATLTLKKRSQNLKYIRAGYLSTCIHKPPLAVEEIIPPHFSVWVIATFSYVNGFSVYECMLLFVC